MRIAVIGTGYVGLVSGACFSEFGVSVTCVDTDAAKIARLRRGEMPIYEPGLEALVADNTAAGRLSFTTELLPAIEGADAVFIAVGTPSRRGDGHADLSYVFAAAAEIGRALAETRAGGYTVVVTKSTVPVGTGREVAAILHRVCPNARFDVASNPEFLREGSAIEDFMRPDRVVIGADSDRAREVMRQVYRPLYLSETPMLFTDIETAELVKYAANAFLATKITFINEIADLCERVGADVQDVARGIGLDGRIGRKFLHAGPGFGGSCFPKDCQALVRTAHEAAADLAIVETVVQVNEARKARMADKIIATCGGTVAGKTIAVLAPRHGRRGDPRLRPGRNRRSEKPDARTRLLRRRLRRCRRRRCAGAVDRMERVPRPRPRPNWAAARRAAGHRPAQHLSAGRDGRRRALLCQHRPPAPALPSLSLHVPGILHELCQKARSRHRRRRFSRLASL
jgi:UDPglucose 6-dehydrogenase